MSILPKTEYRPVTPKDLKLKVEKEGEEPDEDINVEPQEEYKEIEIPYTDKNNYSFLSSILILMFVFLSFYLRKKKI